MESEYGSEPSELLGVEYRAVAGVECEFGSGRQEDHLLAEERRVCRLHLHRAHQHRVPGVLVWPQHYTHVFAISYTSCMYSHIALYLQVRLCAQTTYKKGS